MQNLFKNQVYQGVDMKGLISSTHLYSVFQQEPQLMSQFIRHLNKMYLRKAAVNFVDQFPTMEVEQEEGFYQWLVKGQENKNVALKDAETMDGIGSSVSLGTFPISAGANRERIILVFDEPFFSNTEVIKGETDDYHFLVKRSYEEGGQYKYETELVNDDLDISVPLEALEIGKRFTKLYGLTPGTLSYEGANPWFSTPFKMQNRPSMCRMETQIAGSMIEKGLNEPLLFPFQLNGKDYKVWVNYAEMLVKAQVDEFEAMNALYGKKNWTPNGSILNLDDKTKFEIGNGSGFFDQIAPGNQHKYNSFDIDHLCEMALDMSIGRIPREGNGRHLHILTGERGAIQIHKSIDEKQSTSKFYTSGQSAANEVGLMVGSGAPGNIGHANSLRYGGQFTEYHYYNGVKLTVEVLDFFDDDITFPARHPEGLGTAESHRMLVMGLGEDAGIKRIKIKGRNDVTRVIPGLRDPYTPGGKGSTSPTHASSKLDGYEIVCAKWGGLTIEDPTKVVDWQLNVA
jgi:hypothetical protein